jgi:hypothetical protein
MAGRVAIPISGWCNTGRRPATDCQQLSTNRRRAKAVLGVTERKAKRVRPAGQRRVAQLMVLVASLSAAASVAAAPSRGEMDLAVKDLGADHDHATAALYALQSGGANAASAIKDAWPSLSRLARKRAIVALRALANAHDAAVDALVAAARSEDEELRELALVALRGSSERGRHGLIDLLADPQVGDSAASALARLDSDFAISHLLATLGTEGGADRGGLRDALAAAVRGAKAPGPKLSAWLRGGPPPAAVASAALALSSVEARSNEVASFVAYALAGADDFSTEWRLLLSAGVAAPSVSIDRWLTRELTEPEPWMLRAAAVDALTARGARQQVRPGLSDPHPRVRARAATALSGDPASMLDRATLARRDTWPMVRAAAVESLRTEGDALPVVVASIDDPMSVVRVAAIQALTPAQHDEGWDRIHRRLRANNEWPSVTAAAIDYAVAHCRTDAAESLFRVVMRAAPSSALTEDLNNAALAIEGLRALGTPEANAVIERLRTAPEVPPTLKMALESPVRQATRCPQPGS